MKVLMHICCANCCLYPLQTLRSNRIEVKGLWINPNIHPFTEYAMRIASVRKLQEAWGLDIEYHDVYGLKEFLRAVVNREEDRCAFCYAMRLKETARTAKRLGLDGFTTSLLVSPYQKFDMIVRTGREMEAEFSIPFYYEDFRSGWKNSISLSRELGLYRQNYCGCVYSEMERHIGKNSQTGYKTNDR